ncbi:MAG: S-methyl-5-thioribose-1-phosphate isomerase, partial [Candidatus Aenigmarchaeota archaeon]|nr:S-methyl-5-thioribose-1-phosphate isomerase [Candidatus Aenigmarchaeota archaeon]
APTTTFDVECATGADIPIEERIEDEVLYASGLADTGRLSQVRIAPKGARALNPAFDVTPAKYIAGIITEKGIIKPDSNEIRRLFE